MVTNELETAVPLEEICRHIMNGTVLDIFHLIFDKRKTFKKEIIDILINADGKADSKPGTYKNQVNLAIAKLEAARLIDSNKSGLREEYRLSRYGHIVAETYIYELVDTLCKQKLQDRDYDSPVLSGSIIFQQLIEQMIDGHETA